MRHSSASKKVVLQYVKDGWSYSQIQEKYNVPKSTISTWIKNEEIIPDKDKQLEHLARARNKAMETIHRNKEARLAVAKENAEQELQNISIENISFQKTLLAMLYWTEGSKGVRASLTFVNTDPLLIHLYIWLLRNCYAIQETRLRIRVHVGESHTHIEVINFWSGLLSVPKSQFGKIYVKKRSTQKKFRKNYRGICFVSYGNEAVRQELLALGRLLAENI